MVDFSEHVRANELSWVEDESCEICLAEMTLEEVEEGICSECGHGDG